MASIPPVILGKIFFILSAICYLITSTGHAQSVTEYGVKASFIYNFIKFAELSEETKSIKICVYQDSEVFNEFTPLAELEVQQTKLNVQLISRIEELALCNILFISRNLDIENEQKVLVQARKYSLLTIGETDSFINSGGVISFYNKENKIRFSVSKSALGTSKIVLSSKLLRIANVI